MVGNTYMRIMGQTDFLSGIGRPTVIGAGWHGAFSSFSNVLGTINALEAAVILCILLLAILAASCVAQGALVYLLGAHRSGEKTPYRKALSVGAQAFWPIAMLNVMVLFIFAVLRFFVALPMWVAAERGSLGLALLYVVLFVVFVAVTLILTIMQLFALNAMILQGASVADAILRGWQLFKRHWLVCLETAVILAVISILINIAVSYMIFMLAVPFLLALITAAVVQSTFMFYFVGILCGVFAVSLCLVLVAFLSQLQYATWTFMYRRLGEGGVVPKIHRLIRSVYGGYTVPQN